MQCAGSTGTLGDPVKWGVGLFADALRRDYDCVEEIGRVDGPAGNVDLEVFVRIWSFEWRKAEGRRGRPGRCHHRCGSERIEASK
jgi:hypothetical protein